MQATALATKDVLNASGANRLAYKKCTQFVRYEGMLGRASTDETGVDLALLWLSLLWLSLDREESWFSKNRPTLL